MYLCIVKSEFTHKRFVFKVNVLMVLGYDYFELCSSFTRKKRSSHDEALNKKASFTPREMIRNREVPQP